MGKARSNFRSIMRAVHIGDAVPHKRCARTVAKLSSLRLSRPLPQKEASSHEPYESVRCHTSRLRGHVLEDPLMTPVKVSYGSASG